jgi:hypothetical protein
LKRNDSYTPPFSWNPVIDLSKTDFPVEKVKLSPSSVNPAGEDEIALCNHNVTVKYNPLMEECQAASSLGPTVEMELADGAISLLVGEALCQHDDEDGE